jgi:hypothetical protein
MLIKNTKMKINQQKRKHYPILVDASYILSSDEFIAHEEAMWDLPGDKQTKKFKYDYKIHGDTRYLVITIKAELLKKRHS